jgi:hypothetical protein
MVREMKSRLVEQALAAQKCTKAPTDGPHAKWICPCGSHKTAIPRHREITPGVIRNIIRDLSCLPKGWLQ